MKIFINFIFTDSTYAFTNCLTYTCISNILRTFFMLINSSTDDVRTVSAMLSRIHITAILWNSYIHRMNIFTSSARYIFLPSDLSASILCLDSGFYFFFFFVKINTHLWYAFKPFSKLLSPHIYNNETTSTKQRIKINSHRSVAWKYNNTLKKN